jgi:hypothetical protein
MCHGYCVIGHSLFVRFINKIVFFFLGYHAVENAPLDLVPIDHWLGNENTITERLHSTESL